MRSVQLCLAIGVVACGDGGGSLSDYYPDLPKPTGGPQEVFAGQVTDASELVTGPAQSGLVGDFYIKNDRVTFIVQAPTRVIGVVPPGGNLVDAALTSGGQQIVEDHFGELGLIYLLGRTCEPDRIEIVRDGSEGGVAAIRAVGRSGNNDFINIKGIGAFRVDEGVDPDIEDAIDCATTYVLAPASATLEVHHSLYNDGSDTITGPLGTMADTGGNTNPWSNGRGFEKVDISALTSLGTPAPIDYVVYQAPGVAYGVIPRHDAPTEHAQATIAGVSILLNGNSSILDILQAEKYYLKLEGGKGLRQQYDLVVGRDAAAVDEVFRDGAVRPFSGRVDLSDGTPGVGARVGVYLDGNGNGQLDAADVDTDADNQPDDRIISYLDVAPDGTFAGNVAADAGSLLVRAEIKNVGRSPAMPIADTASFTIPAPIRVDYSIVDDLTGAPVPARLLVVGDHPAFPDPRVFETSDRVDGIVTQVHAIRGTTVDLGDGVDPPLYLPAGGTYRIYASRGTEWSVASQPVTGTANVDLELRLRQVNPAPGYVSSDWHVHQVGSPDANVLSDERIRSAISAGTEVFAVTDHDYVSDLQPLVEQMNAQRLVRVMPGIEVTPFAYGHYNAWPMQPDTGSASGGAIDWARGAAAGFAMVPSEIYAAMRARGAQMLQVNHPRGTGFTAFQAAFSRANVQYDYTMRTIYGDYQNADTPYDWLRLPEESLWSDEFNGLEVWNGFSVGDSNADGVREMRSLDTVMRDWFNMLSLGFVVTPAGNSDTHTAISDPVGMPRTYVRVADDSPDALASGAVVDSILATQLGANGAPRDIVVTNGPMIDVQVGGQPALGRTVSGGGGVTLTVTITSPEWAAFDTLEVFANSTPQPVTTPNGQTFLVPHGCWTSRDLASLTTTDPCRQATVAPEAMTVQLATVPGGGGHRRFEATVTITLDAADIVNRPGATGTDAWLVFRVRGDTGIFPVLPNDAITDATRGALLGGDFAQIRAALAGVGVPAAAFTAPVFVDFDGGGYRAPFAP